MIVRADMGFGPSEADMPLQAIRIKVAARSNVEEMMLSDQGYVLNLEFDNDNELGAFRERLTTMMNKNSSIILPY